MKFYLQIEFKFELFPDIDIPINRNKSIPIDVDSKKVNFTKMNSKPQIKTAKSNFFLDFFTKKLKLNKSSSETNLVTETSNNLKGNEVSKTSISNNFLEKLN